MAKRKIFALNKDLEAGLTQTMSAVKHYAGELRFEIIPLQQIEFDPDNPRELSLTFADLPQGPLKDDVDFKRKTQEINQLNSLAETISKQGLINPVVVYKFGQNYRLIAGERRCLASKIAGKTEIKANILPSKPQELQQRLLQWVENVEREDLTLWERLQNIKMILSAYQKINPEAEVNANIIKNLLACSLPHASNYLHVLNSSKDVLDAIERRDINSLEKAAFISKLNSKDIQMKILNACIAGATIAQMKALQSNLDQQKKMDRKQAVSQRLSAGRGRKATQIKLGSVKESQVIKTLIQSVIEQERFQHYHNHFEKVNWNDFSAVSSAFKNLLEIIQTVDLKS